MQKRNHIISYSMIALLVLMQFVSPFLHTHVSEHGQATSSYAMHFHGDADHDDEPTTANNVVHFEAIASYVSSHNPAITKTILFKKVEPISLLQDEFKLAVDIAEKFPPPITSLSFSKPVSIGFMALAPPVA